MTHAALNKDRGLIDPATGEATDPTTPRGMVGDNFAKAVAGAIVETRRQWQDLRAELTARYGEGRAAHDLRAHPRRSGERLPGRGWSCVLGVLLIASVVVAAAAIILVVRRRGRRRAA